MSKFSKAVYHNLIGLHSVSVGLCPNCEICANDVGMSLEEFNEALENDEIFDEGNFFWVPCETCDSRLAGMRYAAHGLTKNNDLLHLNVCEDCLQFIANGTEPDLIE